MHVRVVVLREGVKLPGIGAAINRFADGEGGWTVRLAGQDLEVCRDGKTYSIPWDARAWAEVSEVSAVQEKLTRATSPQVKSRAGQEGPRSADGL